uniref:Propep_M14 domain-containing protein n=1 Tax=Heterorhabditis bacteriophora TaxID=37862 RepID=A0A1I7WPH2_HETBA
MISSSLVNYIFYLICLSEAKKFTVLRLTPSTKEEVEYLQNIYVENVKVSMTSKLHWCDIKLLFTLNHRLDFWKPPSEPGKEVHVMLDDDMTNKFIPSIDAMNITHSVMIEDLYAIILLVIHEFVRHFLLLALMWQ